MRTIGDYAWAGGKAWNLQPEGTNGRKARLVPFDPGLTEPEDAVRRDKGWGNRRAGRADTPVPFRKDVDAADPKVPHFVKFETDWCVPCKQGRPAEIGPGPTGRRAGQQLPRRPPITSK
jgi:hypothetical protein